MAEHQTVTLHADVKESLRDYKFENRCESFNSAIEDLLEGATEDSE